MKYSLIIVVTFLSACAQSNLTEIQTRTAPAVGQSVDVHLAPAAAGQWQADYSWEQPVVQLDFVRPSNGRRAERLEVVDVDFEIFSNGDNDAIRRKDGNQFSAVSILEPTAIENPPAGYLPFAQFGDGGLLLHTGRFHVCAGPCQVDSSKDEGPWRITIDPGKAGRMILDGVIVTEPTSFLDYGDGIKVYVGQGEITVSPTLLAVIDDALPDTVAQSLNQLLPPLTAYFGERLGRLKQKQMLFASYNVPGDLDGSSIKGGALPQQVFMHFEGAQIPEFSDNPDFRYFLAWFFAHESAHLHQRYRAAQYDRNESWIHEGSADAFAYLALRDLNAAPASYIEKRLTSAKAACANELADGSLQSVLERDGAFQAHYDCGLILHLAAGAAAQRNTGGDLFSVWIKFIENVLGEAQWSANTYLELVRTTGDAKTAMLIDKVINEKIEDPLPFLEMLLLESGFARRR